MNKNIQEKLAHYAPEPPAPVWDRIAAALDEETAALGSRLKAFEAPPPAGAWKKIEAGLGKAAARVVPFYRKAVWPAAAALLLLVAALAYLQTAPPLPAGTGSGSAARRTATPGGSRATATQTAVPSSEPARERQAAGETTEPHSRTTLLAVAEKKETAPLLRPELQLGGLALARYAAPSSAATKTILTSRVSPEKYMVYSDDEGTAMRLPKKLFDLVACVKANPLCKQRMQQLQQQLASTSLSTDFTGVLDILQNLKENQ